MEVLFALTMKTDITKPRVFLDKVAYMKHA